MKTKIFSITICKGVGSTFNENDFRIALIELLKKFTCDDNSSFDVIEVATEDKDATPTIIPCKLPDDYFEHLKKWPMVPGDSPNSPHWTCK